MTYLVIQRQSGDERREVSADGTVTGACPGCGAEPFCVKTHPAEIYDDTTSRAGARCCHCQDPVGWVYVRRETIFGAEEDRAVLEHGRARVYSPLPVEVLAGALHDRIHPASGVLRSAKPVRPSKGARDD